MKRFLVPSLGAAAVLLASGCSTLEPKLPAANAAVPNEWPQAAPSSTAAATPRAAAELGWRDVFRDPKLQEIVTRALEHNRDLRVAVLNVERARAHYRIQRADRLPSLAAAGSLSRTGGESVSTTDVYSAQLGTTNFELDLFGRVHQLSAAALQSYFATEESRRSTHLTLVAEVAQLYVTLAADRDLQRLSEATLQNQLSSLRLIERRHEHGAVSSLDVSQARTLVESARANAAYYAGIVARDTSALALLVGQPVPDDLLPERFNVERPGVLPIASGLNSELLLRRPDVLAAEHQLRAANANIGAARAAFFPRITLTGAVGTASGELSDLFSSGTGVWSFMPQVSVPIFQGGRLRANLDVATADRDIALARYEQSIQAAFREVADALALTQTLQQQSAAQAALVAASARTVELSQARYDAGQIGHLALLDAQRSLFAAQQGLISVQAAEQANRVALYKALGGGWREQSGAE